MSRQQSIYAYSPCNVGLVVAEVKLLREDLGDLLSVLRGSRGRVGRRGRGRVGPRGRGRVGGERRQLVGGSNGQDSGDHQLKNVKNIKMTTIWLTGTTYQCNTILNAFL